jgi:hypothetical protein
MPVDLVHQANVRDQRLIELGGIVDQGGRYSAMAHELYITSVEAKKAFASGNREYIIRNCYVASTQRQAAGPSTRQNNLLALPPVLVPHGTIYMCSEHGTRMRMNGGHVVLVYGHTAAEMLAQGSHRVATKAEVELYKEERKRSVAEIKAKEIELHPERQPPIMQLQTPEGFSQVGYNGLRADQVIISRGELSELISRGIDEYINKSVDTVGSEKAKEDKVDKVDKVDKADKVTATSASMSATAATTNGHAASTSTPTSTPTTSLVDGIGGPTYDDADDNAVTSGNQNLTSPPKLQSQPQPAAKPSTGVRR